MWVPPVTIIFLTYATSSIKTVWGGGDETVFLSALVKKKKKQHKNYQIFKIIILELSHTCTPPQAHNHHSIAPACRVEV